jgi:hypothetical protein
MERLRITVEFNKNRKDEVELYNELQKYSNPGAYIKDVLKGLAPIPGKFQTGNNTNLSNCNNEYEEDNEDLMDI